MLFLARMGFWSKLGKIAGVVGGGAAIALTGGAAAPVVAGALKGYGVMRQIQSLRSGEGRRSFARVQSDRRLQRYMASRAPTSFSAVIGHGMRRMFG